MNEFKAKIARHSTAMAKIFNAEIVHFIYSSANHGLISTSLTCIRIKNMIEWPKYGMGFPVAIVLMTPACSIHRKEYCMTAGITELIMIRLPGFREKPEA